MEEVVWHSVSVITLWSSRETDLCVAFRHCHLFCCLNSKSESIFLEQFNDCKAENFGLRRWMYRTVGNANYESPPSVVCQLVAECWTADSGADWRPYDDSINRLVGQQNDQMSDNISTCNPLFWCEWNLDKAVIESGLWWSGCAIISERPRMTIGGSKSS
jgi:hypothetical protein